VEGAGEIQVGLSRAELTAVREAVELTPNFEGRLDVRDTLRAAMKARSNGVALERDVAERFVKRLAAIDLPTALVKVKLLRAIQDFDRDDGAASDDSGRPARAA
jgi:hypothetical protein